MKKPQAVLILIAIALALLLIFSFHKRNQKQMVKASPDAQSQDQEIQNFGKAEAIDGITVRQSQAARPFAVVIENYPDARPQSGLSQADTVYEALAEGGITRFLAVFQTEDVKSIGPVRSARTYFNDWAQELGAVYAHVGGNSDALAQIRAGIPGISDADQFFNDPYFTRIKTRQPPHNTYTSTDKLKALAQAREYDTEPSYGAYVFKNDAPAAKPDAAAISIDFSTPTYAVKWIYNPASDSYKRYLAGSAVVDAGNNQNVIVKNIIVQRVRNWPVQSDTPLAIGMATREGGSADIYLDGTVIHGSWKYVNGRTRYYDSNGKEIALNRGRVWIEIVPPDNSVTSK